MIGGIFLICGTTIGAGMLAMPISTGFGGFFPSIFLLVLLWLTMLCTAFFFLDVNLHVRGEPNLISMAGATLGNRGKMITWFFYLLLLYSLVAAYIAGGAPILADGLASIGISIPSAFVPFTLPLLFGGFIYLGTLGVDYINRILMIGLVFSFAILVSYVPTASDTALLFHSDYPALLLGVSIVVTSFGYHIIIPSLTTYMEHNVKMLRWTILIGSIIPLLIYVAWQYSVLDVLNLQQIRGAWDAGEPATLTLATLFQKPILATIAKSLTFFAVITSFLGVSLSLSDFLIDGFNIKKGWEGRLLAIGLTFIPPLIFVYTYKRGFYLALQYGGAFVTILLIILPVLMAWRLPGKFYRSPLGKISMALVLLIGLALIFVNVIETRGDLQSLLTPYAP